ncbi:MAG: hypothetical protein ACI4J4_03480 [Ruminiclostridium sp.]
MSRVREIMTKIIEKAKTIDKKRIGEYILWQLENMRNQNVAETTADEFERGIFTLDNIYDKVKEEVRKTVKRNEVSVPDCEVYAMVRKIIAIDGTVKEDELPFDPLNGRTTKAAPVEKIPASVDFDSLWD